MATLEGIEIYLKSDFLPADIKNDDSKSLLHLLHVRGGSTEIKSMVEGVTSNMNAVMQVSPASTKCVVMG